MRFVVGGRALDLTEEEVVRAMRGVQPEPIREHQVQIDRTVFPPKQVLAHLTGWDRTSFTTMEANRVFSRLGFTHQRAGDRNGQAGWLRETQRQRDSSSVEQRLSAIEAALAVAQEAIAGLRDRVDKLEGRKWRR